MRTIYILNSDALTSDKQIKAYESLITFLNKKDHYSASTIFVRMEGKEAYSFLLYWMIGGVNPKRLFDDSRIIGDVRSIWNKMFVSPSPRAQILVGLYNHLFINLFTDSTKLAGLIKLYEEVNRTECSRLLKLACDNCTWVREKRFLELVSGFNYQYFAEDTHLIHMKESLELSQKKLLEKAELSPTGEVCFFKSNYEMTAEKLEAISKRLKANSDLLQLIDRELEDNVSEETLSLS